MNNLNRNTIFNLCGIPMLKYAQDVLQFSIMHFEIAIFPHFSKFVFLLLNIILHSLSKFTIKKNSQKIPCLWPFNGTVAL